MHNQDSAVFGKVAVVMGGSSAEREISLSSGQAVVNALSAQGVDVIGLDTQTGALAQLQGQAFDRVFNMIHGRGGEDGVLQGLLEFIGIPYTGSGVLASALSLDKHRSKYCWLGAGLPTPGWRVLRNEADVESCADELGFPLMVKPALEGSSLGMSKAVNVEQLRVAWREASEYQCEVMAEAWVEGREYTVGLLQGQALPVIRLQTAREFYDYQAKYIADDTEYHCPCGLSTEQERVLQALALEASDLLGVQGWGRVDILLDGVDKPWLIEVNTVPGMTDHSLVPMAAEAAGMNFKQLVWKILETSLEQNPVNVP